MSRKFKDLYDRNKVLLVIGTGGVGKTTTSIAIALAAAKEGKKVALLSIDPAKRLAAAIGLKLDADLHEIKNYPKAGGRLDAMMLDAKVVFDGLVKRLSRSAKLHQETIKNPLYQAASTKLAGTIEFMSLTKITEIYRSAQYDFMVVDTPPDTHSIDFLCKPHILSSFHDNKVMQWFVKPLSVAGSFGLGKVLSLGRKVMSGLFQLTGLQTIQTLSDFLVLMQDVIKGLHESGLQIREILESEDSGFLLVGVPNEASLLGMVNLTNELEERNFHLDGVLLNKCLPEDIAQEILKKKDESVFHENQDLGSFLSRTLLEERIKTSLYEKYLKSQGGDCLIYKIPEVDYPLHSLEAMEKFSD